MNMTLINEHATNSEESLNSIITKCFLKNVELQNKIEYEVEIDKKIGRPSNNKHMKSSEINNWLSDIFHNKILKLI